MTDTLADATVPGDTTDKPDILTLTDVSLNFGGLAAVANLHIRIAEGELVGLIGPNGAGKTSVFNLLTGVYPPSSGEIVFRRDDNMIKLDRKKPDAICRAGIGRTFQNIRLFRNMTVLENVAVARAQHVRYGLVHAFLHTPRYGRIEEEIRAQSIELLRIMGLDAKADERASNMSYGEQRRLEIARAMATDPVLLLLDEPAAGMNPAETAQLTDLIGWLRQHFGLTILLIEHDMSLVMHICERIYVLDHGLLIASGSPESIKNDPLVIKAYLGEEVIDA